MSANLEALFADLAARGVKIEANGDHLRIDAPAGVVTPELRQTLVEHRAKLLAHLAGRQETTPTPPEVLRIPLEFGSSPSEWLAARGLKIVGGTPHFGGKPRPMLFLDASSPEEAVA